MRMPCAAAGAAAGATFLWYHGQSPTSQLYGATIARVPGAGARIALTYDDGPNPRVTPLLLGMLERHGAKATFFSVGRFAAREPALLRELAAGGHAVGNHTWSHPSLPRRRAGEVREELRRTRDAIEAAGVELATVDGAALMRPPYGRRRPGTLRTLRAAGYVPVLWSVTGWDWRARETAATIAARGERARGGDVVLLHDGHHRTPAADRFRSLAATEAILAALGAQGVQFVTVPELVAAARAGGAA